MESLATLQANYDAHAQAADKAGVQLSDVVPLMRTVFVSKDAATLRRVREALQAQDRTGGPQNARLIEGETLDDWALIGTPESVDEQLRKYEASLGMSHLIATRIRVPGLEEGLLRTSITLLAELVGDR